MVFDIEIIGMNFNGVLYIGYNIIEIGVVEVINCCLIGWIYYVYIKFLCEVEEEVIKVYGIINEFL